MDELTPKEAQELLAETIEQLPILAGRLGLLAGQLQGALAVLRWQDAELNRLYEAYEQPIDREAYGD